MSSRPTNAELDELEKQLRSWDHCWPADWLERPVIQTADALAALRRERSEARRQVETLREALKEVEAWWLSHGMKTLNGAPYCMFRARVALAETETNGAAKC